MYRKVRKKTIGKYLCKNYIVEASMGHVRDLPKSKLGVDIEDNFIELMDAINSMAETYDLPIIYSMHPRSKKYIEQREIEFHPNVRSLQPFGFDDYNALQKNVVAAPGCAAEHNRVRGQSPRRLRDHLQ